MFTSDQSYPLTLSREQRQLWFSAIMAAIGHSFNINNVISSEWIPTSNALSAAHHLTQCAIARLDLAGAICLLCSRIDK